MKTKNKKKQKSNKEKNKKIISPRQESSSCLDITCLNNLLTVQKFSKDNVVNFIAQKNRLEGKQKIAGKRIYFGILNILFLFSASGNKRDKSNFIENAKNYLMGSIGGENAMKMKRPMCGGHYNTTEGMLVCLFLLFVIINLFF